MVPEEMAGDTDLEARTIRTFVALSRRANKDRVAIVRQTTLGRAVGVGRATVQRELDELERRGYIRRRQRMRPSKGGWGSNEYLVAPFPDAHAQARSVGIVQESDAQRQARTLGDAMPSSAHDSGQSDAQPQARSVGSSIRPSSQTFLLSDQRGRRDGAKEHAPHGEEEDRQRAIESLERDGAAPAVASDMVAVFGPDVVLTMPDEDRASEIQRFSGGNGAGT